LQVGDPALDAQATLRPPALPGELGDLAQAMDRMRQRLAGREQLEHDVRALTHELKSPLAAIQGASEFLQDELAAADRQRFGQQIDAQVERLRDLVDRLLALSQLENQRAPRQRQPVDLVALSEQVLAEQAARLAQRGLQLDWAAREHQPVWGDPAALALAWSNLLSNACQHAPAGSVLTLAVRRVGRRLHWSLRDRGPGVPDFALPQLGQRFFATANPVDGRKGSGLGLAIVQQVMALHGGHWQAEPAQPGLQVTLSLPID
jgi:two-component system sensor histidine kinase CreC